MSLQDRHLANVSRTFALTIPLLPKPLIQPVANAYLLCRIADTIEDETGLSIEQKRYFQNLFVETIKNNACAHRFANELSDSLSDASSIHEIELVRDSYRVIEITTSLKPEQRTHILRCVKIMCKGMPAFQRRVGPNGLDNMTELDDYCYYVAGVVGEMLTGLFCDYAPAIAERRSELLELSVSFGQGLQMTNIIKDFWEDRTRGVCWLPKDVFDAQDCHLSSLDSKQSPPEGFQRAVDQLLAIAHSHLRKGFEYTLLIPSKETGIRRFCLLAIGLALLTLKKIYNSPEYGQGHSVKITRISVKRTYSVTSVLCRRDLLLRLLLEYAGRGLPIAKLAD